MTRTARGRRGIGIGLGLLVATTFAAAAALTTAWPQAAAKDADAAFTAFWDARTPREAAKTVPDIVASGVSFDEALKRLKAGRLYAADVSKGVVRTSRRADGKEFFYSINVPASYDPAQRYQVRIQLHGGVGREGNTPRGDGSIGSLASPPGAEQIYILPTAWNDAPWWGDDQIENIDAILDTVKRTYNVDENRVVLAGVSDGGTGTFYFAMRDTTPFASFLSLNGFIDVLNSVVEDDLFPNNLLNKPFFLVNGGKDPLYPIRIVEPYVEHLKDSGVSIEYDPQPNGVHNTAWWPEVRVPFEAFVRKHPRQPLPDTLTWESTGDPLDNRADWLVIDKIAPGAPAEAATAQDVNHMGQSRLLFNNGEPSGRVDLVKHGNDVKATTRGVAEFTLLLSPDAFDFSRPISVETDGRVAFEGMVTKSVATLATWAARDNDRTMLFGAELHVTVP
jgi:hypothetical protein